MSLKKRIFYSNLLMLIIPTASVAIVVRILVTMFMTYFLPDFYQAHVTDVNDSELQSLLTNENVAQFITFTIIIIAIVVFIVIAVSLTLTNNMLKKIMVPITRLYDGAQRIQDGNFNEDIPLGGKDELEKVCEAFNDMQHQLKSNIQKNEMYEKDRNEMLAGISHDLRTPLTSIKSYVKGIQDGVAQTPEKEKEYLNIVYRNACDMEGLLNQLFLFSKLKTGNQPFHFKPIILQKYIVTVLDSLEYNLHRNNSKLILDSNCTTEKVMIDGEQMKRVIANILENSIKYNPDRELHITVTLLKQSDNIIMRIQDDGIGASDQQLSLLFNSFYRGDESRSNAMDGSGLGLSIAKYIVEAHGGKISAENHNGLTIVMILPVVKEE